MNTKRKEKNIEWNCSATSYRNLAFFLLLYVFRKLSVMSHGRCHHCEPHIHPHTRYISGFLFCLQTDETGCWIMSDTNFPTAVRCSVADECDSLTSIFLTFFVVNKTLRILLWFDKTFLSQWKLIKIWTLMVQNRLKMD